MSKAVERLLEGPRLLLTIVSLMMLVSPGFTFFFLFRNELFLELDYAKLITLSIVFIVPAFLVNCLFIDWLKLDIKKDQAYGQIVLGSVLSGGVGFMIIGFNFVKKLAAINLIWQYMAAEIVLMFLMWLSLRAESKS